MENYESYSMITLECVHDGEIITPEENKEKLKQALSEGCNVNMEKELDIVGEDGDFYFLRYTDTDDNLCMMRIDIDSLTTLREILTPIE